jgi:hypothetical protein
MIRRASTTEARELESVFRQSPKDGRHSLFNNVGYFFFRLTEATKRKVQYLHFEIPESLGRTGCRFRQANHGAI